MIKFILPALLLAPAVGLCANTYPALALLSPDYIEDKTSNIEAPNMPPIRSQDGLNICYGFSSWTLFQQYQCSAKNRDCSKVGLDDSPSPLYLAATASAFDSDPKSGAGESIPYNKGGNSSNALLGFKSMGGSYADSCYPFDQFVSNHKNSNKETSAAFENLRKNYYEKNKTEGSICTDCLVKTLEDEFDLKRDSQSVLKALSQESFDRFLFDIFLKDCPTIVDAPVFKVNLWPSAPNPSYETTISKFKEILKSGRPFSMGACLTEKKPLSNGSCPTAHDFVISGYRKYCKPDGTCRESLKVANSWGEDWQKENNDGWVDAKILYDYMGKEKNGITWITKN